MGVCKKALRGGKGRGDWEEMLFLGGRGGGWKGVEGKTGEDLNVWRQGRNLNVLRVGGGGGQGDFPSRSHRLWFLCVIFSNMVCYFTQ